MRNLPSGDRRSTPRRRRSLVAIVAAVVSATVLAVAAPAFASAPAPSASSGTATSVEQGRSATKPTIVLVHGAWAGASSFDPVTGLLQAQGYNVVNAPNPLRGPTDDIAGVVAYVRAVHPEPVILVGHSYGGMVITGAANELPNVKGLVYIDAFAPDTGESALSLTQQNPGSLLSPSVFQSVDYPKQPLGDHDTYIPVDRYKEIFAANVPTAITKVLAADQSPAALFALVGTLTSTPAWKSLPSWFFIGTDDKVLPPATQRFMAKRAGGTIVEGSAPHLAMYGSPFTVAQLISRAAKSVG